MKQISLLILGSLLSLPAFGREISGIVVDSSTGETLVGATVYVKQLPKLGTATGLDGTFSLKTDIENPTLVCSYLGYETQVINKPGTTPLTIKMAESTAELSPENVGSHHRTQFFRRRTVCYPQRNGQTI